MSESQRKNSTFWLFILGCILTCITNIPSAYVHTATNTAVKALEQYINNSYITRGIENVDITHFTGLYYSSWYAGQVIGALCSPYVTDTYGRKFAYIVSTAIMTFACGLQTAATFTPYPELLIIGRVIASMFSPMSDAVLILYLQEISPTEMRGVMSSLMTTGYAAMAVLGIVLGTECVLGYSLSLLLFIPVIPGFISLVFLSYLKETPKFLAITKNDKEKAVHALRFYRGNMSDEDCNAVIDTYDSEKQGESDTKGSIIHLFTKTHLRKALFLSFVLLLLTLPFYPILQASTAIYEGIHLPNYIAQISSTMTMIALFFACIFAAVLLKRYGRVTLIVAFGLMSVISLSIFVFAAHFATHLPLLKFVAFGGLVGYIISYGLAIGPIAYFIATELVPLRYRSSMFCMVFSLNSILIVITTFSCNILLKRFGPITFVPLFILPSSFAVVFLAKYLPETKDREIISIVEDLKRQSGDELVKSCARIEKFKVYPEV